MYYLTLSNIIIKSVKFTIRINLFLVFNRYLEMILEREKSDCAVVV